MAEVSFGTIQFRNGIYQGFKTQLQPEGLGLFMDDDMVLHCSSWNAAQLNNQTAILISHGKYVYGEWKSGLPHGFNVFRSGDTVLLGNFSDGKLNGQFIVIFERQNFVLMAYPSDNSFTIAQKREFKTESELKKIVSNALDNLTLEEEYFQFVEYLHTNFCIQDSLLGLQLDNGVYRFGYENGLGATFDDNNFISKLGCIDDQEQMCGLGVLYSKVIQVGNFANGLIIKYRPNHKPIEDIRKLFKNQHKKSIYFKNDFMFTRTAEVIASLESILKRVVQYISQNRVDTERSGNREELNESLEYRPKASHHSEQNQRLRMIREELHRSIGLPVNIRPSASEAKMITKYPDEIKQLHLKRFNQAEYQEPDSISFSHNGRSKKDNRKSFIKENRLEDYRDDVRWRDGGKHSPDPVDKFQVYKSNKSTDKQSRSPIKESKVHFERSPSNHFYKEQQISTSHREDKRYQPANNFNTMKHHSHKRGEGFLEKIDDPLEDSLQSPFRRHIFNESRKSGSKRSDFREQSSRQYIPVSHSKVVKPVTKSPSKGKRPKEKRQPQTVQFKETGLPARSYLALYKNASPQKVVIKQSKKSPSKKSPSPLKNPYYQREPVEPLTYTKQSTKLVNPYLRRSGQIQRQRESPQHRSKMVEKISRKYNYVYQNL